MYCYYDVISNVSNLVLFHLLHSLRSLQSSNISFELFFSDCLFCSYLKFFRNCGCLCAIMPRLHLGNETPAVLTELAICFPNYHFEMYLCRDN